MGVIRCPNGHWYSDSLPSCPRCGVKLSVSAAQAMSPGGGRGANDDRTIAMDCDNDRTVAMGMDDDITIAGLDTDDDEVTVRYFSDAHGGEPTVGWLVCTRGPERGRDYRIKTAKNFVGRSASMDISVSDDRQIFRERHFSIVYDPKGNEFYAVSGEGAVTVNGENLINSKKLNDGDVLELGGSEFVFVPFCREGRVWEEAER